LSLKYTDRLADAGLQPSVGSDSYDNALAEIVIGLYKTEVIRRLGPWRSLEQLDLMTLEWVDWFNNRRLLEPLGHIPPAEAEAKFFELPPRKPGHLTARALRRHRQRPRTRLPGRFPRSDEHLRQAGRLVLGLPRRSARDPGRPGRSALT
jgi:hypothetical protein